MLDHVKRALLALALIASACTTSPSVQASPSVVASATEPRSTPTATPAPVAASSTVGPSLTPSASPSGAAATLSITPLGKLSGQIAWVVNVPSTVAFGAPTALELWAMPLDGSPVRMAVRYASTQVGPNPGCCWRTAFETNVLRRQFSPDGRRVVLSIAVGTNANRHSLAIVDLEAGKVLQQVGGTDANYLNPAWSPDGSKIAFVRATGGLSTEIWVMDADGTNARRLRPAAQGTTTPIFGWTADSTRIGFAPVNFERSSFALIDLNGVVSGQAPDTVSPNTADPVDWRKGSPAFAMSFQDPGPLPARSNVIVGDDPAQRNPHIIADVVINPSDNNVTGVRDPRWDPTGKFRVIYIQNGTLGAGVLNDFGVGTTQAFGGRVYRAEWLQDGSGFVTLEEHPSTAPLTVVRYDANGRAQGDPLPLSKTSTTYRLIDLAPRAY